MALPSGVSTATVTFGTDADVLGVGATTTLTITPSHTLIWAATGEIIRAFSVSVDAAANVVGSFEIPHTDQVGFTDELGRAITNWFYTVAGLVTRGGEVQPYRKVFQVTSDVVTMNLDLVPVDGMVRPVGTAPVAAVTSVVGATGPISAATIFAAIEPDLQNTIGSVVAQATAGIVSAPAPVLTPCEVLAGIIDFGSVGRYRGAITGDSTWNDGNDPNRKLLHRLAQLTPSGFGLREFLTAGGASPSYGTTVTVRAGETTPDIGGTVLTDTFNRSGELSGSASSGGQTWAGTAGSWTGDGSKATIVGTNALMFNTGAKDETITADTVVVTTSPATARQLRVIGCATTTSPTTGGNYVWAQINISTSGICQASLWKRIGGVNTQIGATITLTTTGVPANSATPVNVQVVLAVAIQAITATVKIAGQADQVITGTLTETDVAALGTFGGISGSNGGSQVTVDGITMAIPFTPGTYRGLDVYNGAVGGTSLDYQTTHVAALYPSGTPLDYMIITQGHNSTGLSEAAFVARVDAFVTAFRALHPGTPIMIASQNPQFAPAATMVAHARNQRALRQYAMDKGFEYLPAFEAFTDQPDGGASLVNPGDGIHPTVSGTSDITTWCGNLLITAVWMRMINGRRRVGVSTPINALP